MVHTVVAVVRLHMAVVHSVGEDLVVIAVEVGLVVIAVEVGLVAVVVVGVVADMAVAVRTQWVFLVHSVMMLV